MSEKRATGTSTSAANVPRTQVGKGKRGDPPPTNEGEKRGTVSQRPMCEKCGQVHTKCNGHTRNGPNKGKPCGANPPRGQTICIKHGGNKPEIRRAAKERLMELVEPALVALQRVLSNPDTDDSVKVRASQIILDRTGFGPGSTVHLDTKVSDWDALDAEVTVDRTGLQAAADIPSAGPPSEVPTGEGDSQIVDADWWEERESSADRREPEQDWTPRRDDLTHHRTPGESAGTGSSPLDFRTTPSPQGASEFDPTEGGFGAPTSTPTREQLIEDDHLPPRNQCGQRPADDSPKTRRLRSRATKGTPPA